MVKIVPLIKNVSESENIYIYIYIDQICIILVKKLLQCKRGGKL